MTTIVEPNINVIYAPRKNTSALNPSEVDHTTVYCSGRCRTNDRLESVANIGMWWGMDNPRAIRNTRECHLGIQTDDIAGLLAVIRVLETALSGSQELVIKTDSRYALNCVEAIVHIWLTDGWHTSQNKATLNRPLVQYCAALIQYLSLRGLCIKISYSEDEKCTRELASQAVHLPDGRTTNWDTKRLSLWNYTTTMHRSLIIHEMRMEVKIRFHLTMKKEKVAIVHLLSSRMNDALLTWHEAFQNVQTSDLDSNLSSHDSDTTEQSDTSKRSATETPRELSSPQASKPQASSRLGASTIDTESNLRKDDDNFDYYSAILGPAELRAELLEAENE